MPQDFEQFVKEVFGGITQFSGEQMSKINTKLNDLVRECVKEELTKIHTEIAQLRERVATLESDRVAASAEQA